MITTPSTARLGPAQGQGLLDRRERLQLVPGDPPRGQVALGELVDVDRGHLDPGRDPLAGPVVAQRHPIEEVLGVGVRPHLGADEGDLLAGASARARPGASIRAVDWARNWRRVVMGLTLGVGQGVHPVRSARSSSPTGTASRPWRPPCRSRSSRPRSGRRGSAGRRPASGPSRTRPPSRG